MGNEATIEQLRAAKEYLFEHGWTRGSREAADGSVCLVGACGKIAGVDGMACYRLPAVHALSDQLGGRYCWDWNDAPDRTFDEVVDLIDATIKDLES
jgi:hypothetical protein